MSRIENSVRNAIGESQSEDRIVHLTYSAEAADYLRRVAKDYVETRETAEFWGTVAPQSEIDGSIDEGDWRVHLDREEASNAKDDS